MADPATSFSRYFTTNAFWCTPILPDNELLDLLDGANAIDTLANGTIGGVTLVVLAVVMNDDSRV